MKSKQFSVCGAPLLFQSSTHVYNLEFGQFPWSCEVCLSFFATIFRRGRCPFQSILREFPDCGDLSLSPVFQLPIFAPHGHFSIILSRPIRAIKKSAKRKMQKLTLLLIMRTQIVKCGCDFFFKHQNPKIIIQTQNMRCCCCCFLIRNLISGLFIDFLIEWNFSLLKLKTTFRTEEDKRKLRQFFFIFAYFLKINCNIIGTFEVLKLCIEQMNLNNKKNPAISPQARKNFFFGNLSSLWPKRKKFPYQVWMICWKS